MKCSDCKFWHPPEFDAEDMKYGAAGWMILFGTCVQTPFAEYIGHWDFEAEPTRWVLEDEHKHKTAAVQDGSGYSARLLTKPDHFCAMFVNKGD